MAGLGAVAAVQTAIRNRRNGNRKEHALDSTSGPDRPDNKEETPAGAQPQQNPAPGTAAAAAQQQQPQRAGGDVPAQASDNSGCSTRKKRPVSVMDNLFRYQDAAYHFYQDVRMQVFVASLIGANFLTNVIQMQVDPGNDENPVFNGLSWFYNVVFAFELAFNMYSTWFFRFWESGWNRFDFVVVSIGLLDQFDVPLPGPLTLLRMMRAFRVFRLFKKVKELNKIIVALQNAVPGVVNAFVIMVIVMAIYAILAVEFYQLAGGSCKDHEHEEDHKFMTGRGDCIGEEYFGNFLSSLYTLFQVLTGDSWSEAIARPLMQWKGAHELVTGFFFVSFVLINGIVLINVVIAVILERMVTPEGGDEDAGASGDAEGGGREGVELRSVEDRAGDVPRQRRSSSAGPPNTDVVSLLSEVSALRSNMLVVRGEVETVSAELNSGLDRTQDDIGSMKEQLDVILAAVQQVAAARRAL